MLRMLPECCRGGQFDGIEMKSVNRKFLPQQMPARLQKFFSQQVKSFSDLGIRKVKHCIYREELYCAPKIIQWPFKSIISSKANPNLKSQVLDCSQGLGIAIQLVCNTRYQFCLLGFLQGLLNSKRVFCPLCITTEFESQVSLAKVKHINSGFHRVLSFQLGSSLRSCKE